MPVFGLQSLPVTLDEYGLNNGRRERTLNVNEALVLTGFLIWRPTDQQLGFGLRLGQAIDQLGL